jgi:hypothetical protein
MMGGSGGGLGGAEAAGAAATTGDGAAAGGVLGAGAAAVVVGEAVVLGWLPPSAAHPISTTKAEKTIADRNVTSMITLQKRRDLADRSHRPLRRLRTQTLG